MSRQDWSAQKTNLHTLRALPIRIFVDILAKKGLKEENREYLLEAPKCNGQHGEQYKVLGWSDGILAVSDGWQIGYSLKALKFISSVTE